MVQDYTLFHIFNTYSLDLWKRQADLIMEKHGMMSFIVHPDYVRARDARIAYESLLDYLVELREQHEVWIALPHEVNEWWRQRAAMRIMGNEAEGWRLVGPGSERARIAYATEVDGRLAVRLDSSDAPAGALCTTPMRPGKHTDEALTVIATRPRLSGSSCPLSS
jgi:hypothetical protein